MAEQVAAKGQFARKIHWSFTVNTAREELEKQYHKVKTDNLLPNN
ncbi:hypothetical protein [Pontibacter qinzhouensis]|nr:hypothetical protein [Pontibacter qinzhouensis]